MERSSATCSTLRSPEWAAVSSHYGAPLSAILPDSMRAIVVKDHATGATELVRRPVPKPKPGQALVRVAFAPVNPNDLLASRGRYEVRRPVGAVLGFEGSGVVVGGSGMMARLMRGRRVAFGAGEDGGSWAEYSVADATQCLPLRGGVTDEQGATLLTNPITATVLLQQARREGHRVILQAGAAGALGTMMARLAPTMGLTMVHLVRSEEQVAWLRGVGAEHVIRSDQADFEQALVALCHRLGATLALDPVAGPLTGTLLRALVEGGVVRIYGALSGAPPVGDTDELLFRGKRIEGFTMYDWVKSTSMLGQLLTAMRAQGQLGGALATELRGAVPLEEHAVALQEYQRSMSGGKLLFDALAGAGTSAG